MKNGTLPNASNWRAFAEKCETSPLADAFPLLDEESEDFYALAESVEIHGVLEPIVLDFEMRVLDGRNRLRAALIAPDLPRPPQFVFFDDLPIDHNEMGEREFVIAKNLARRQMTADQRAAAVALVCSTKIGTAAQRSAENLIPGAVHRRGEITPSKKTESKRTREMVQEEAKVSEHKARQALDVAVRAPELAKEVAAGKVALKDAAKKVREAKANAPKKKPLAPAASKPQERDPEKLIHRVHDDVRALTESVRLTPAQATRLRMLAEAILRRLGAQAEAAK